MIAVRSPTDNNTHLLVISSHGNQNYEEQLESVGEQIFTKLYIYTYIYTFCVLSSWKGRKALFCTMIFVYYYSGVPCCEYITGGTSLTLNVSPHSPQGGRLCLPASTCLIRATALLIFDLVFLLCCGYN